MVVDTKVRGRYAKGKAMRKLILNNALNIIATEGFNQATLSKISQSVHLTEAGVLHYFDSMDDLLVQVLKQRDTDDIAAAVTSIPELLDQIQEIANHPEQSIISLLSTITKNERTPGLVELYANMSVKAAIPDSPAHKYFVHRAMIERRMVGYAVKKVLKKQHRTPVAPAEDVARIIQALIDGLQFQWLADNTVDMHALARTALSAMYGPTDPLA